MRRALTSLVALSLVACAPVETRERVLEPVPDTVTYRPGCTGRGVDTFVLDLIEVTVAPGADPGTAGRVGGLCAACGEPGSQVSCALRQRVCRCVAPEDARTDADGMRDAFAGAVLDAPLEDATTCVRVIALARDEASASPDGAPAWDCSDLSICGDAPLSDGVTMCGLSDAVGPDAADVPVTPQVVACGPPPACETLARLCAEPRRTDLLLDALCDDYAALCPDREPLFTVAECLAL